MARTSRTAPAAVNCPESAPIRLPPDFAFLLTVDPKVHRKAAPLRGAALQKLRALSARWLQLEPTMPKCDVLPGGRIVIPQVPDEWQREYLALARDLYEWGLVYHRIEPEPSAPDDGLPRHPLLREAMEDYRRWQAQQASAQQSGNTGGKKCSNAGRKQRQAGEAAREPNKTVKRILAHCRRKAHTGERIAEHLNLTYDHVRHVLARLVKAGKVRNTADGYRTV